MNCMFQTNKRSLYFISYKYICDQQICTLYRSKEHFEHALLDGLDLLELDLKGSLKYLFIIVFLIYKIQNLPDEAFLANISE